MGRSQAPMPVLGHVDKTVVTHVFDVFGTSTLTSCAVQHFLAMSRISSRVGDVASKPQVPTQGDILRCQNVPPHVCVGSVPYNPRLQPPPPVKGSRSRGVEPVGQNLCPPPRTKPVGHDHRRQSRCRFTNQGHLCQWVAAAAAAGPRLTQGL